MRLLAVLLALALLPAVAEASPWQGITALTVSADGGVFATGGREGEVVLRETSTGEILGRWTNDALPVAGLSFSQDGSSLGVVLLNGVCSTIRLADGSVSPSDTKTVWGTLNGAVDRALSRAPVLYGVAASSNGIDAKGLPDGTIQVSPPGSAAVTWQAHPAAVTALAFVSEGVLLSAGYDGSIGRWDARTGRALGRL